MNIKYTYYFIPCSSMKNISGVGSVVQSYLKESPEDLDYSPKKGLKEEISPRLEEQPDIVQDLSKKVIFNLGIQQLNTLL